MKPMDQTQKIDLTTALPSHESETMHPETDHTEEAIERPADDETAKDSPVHEWFFTFMCINIPFAGWIYLIYLAFSKKRTHRRNFARAYLFYKLLFLVISIILLGIIVYISLDMVDQLLAYMEML